MPTRRQFYGITCLIERVILNIGFSLPIHLLSPSPRRWSAAVGRSSGQASGRRSATRFAGYCCRRCRAPPSPRSRSRACCTNSTAWRACARTPACAGAGVPMNRCGCPPDIRCRVRDAATVYRCDNPIGDRPASGPDRSAARADTSSGPDERGCVEAAKDKAHGTNRQADPTRLHWHHPAPADPISRPAARQGPARRQRRSAHAAARLRRGHAKKGPPAGGPFSSWGARPCSEFDLGRIAPGTFSAAISEPLADPANSKSL